MQKPSFLKYHAWLAGFHADLPAPLVPELTHAGEEWVPADYKIPMHRHAVWEFYYQIQGVTEWQCDGRLYHAPMGTLLGISPGIDHALIKPSDDCHHFYYAGVDLNAVYKRIPKLKSIFSSQRIVHSTDAEVVAFAFRQFLREVSVMLPLRDTALRLTMDNLLIEIGRIIMGKAAKSLIVSHPAVRHAEELLTQKPSEAWTTKALARAIGLSVSRLNECFRTEIGITPRQYLIQKRLELAAQTLRYSDIPITMLAYDLGFSSSQHFATAFRKHYGINARNYRKRSQGLTSP